MIIPLTTTVHSVTVIIGRLTSQKQQAVFDIALCRISCDILYRERYFSKPGYRIARSIDVVDTTSRQEKSFKRDVRSLLHKMRSQTPDAEFLPRASQAIKSKIPALSRQLNFDLPFMYLAPMFRRCTKERTHQRYAISLFLDWFAVFTVFRRTLRFIDAAIATCGCAAWKRESDSAGEEEGADWSTFGGDFPVRSDAIAHLAAFWRIFRIRTRIHASIKLFKPRPTSYVTRFRGIAALLGAKTVMRVTLSIIHLLCARPPRSRDLTISRGNLWTQPGRAKKQRPIL